MVVAGIGEGIPDVARVTHVDLFSGIGGFAVAAQWAGFKTIAFCESDSRCRSFLEKEWGLPVEPDIRKLDGTKYRGISLLTGGPPCQPASRAGKQGGAGDDRWLWPEALRVLEEAKPDCVVFENPPGIGDVGLDGILSEMGRLSYEVQVFDIPACAVDSPQLRHRFWIVGFRTMANAVSGGRNLASISVRREEPRQVPMLTGSSEGSLAYTERERCDIRGEQPTEQPARDRRAGFTGDSKDDMADSTKQGRERPNTESRPNGCSPKHRESNLGDTAECEREPSGPQSDQRGVVFPYAWNQSVWVSCADNKLRRAPNESIHVAHGLHRSILGALGNAIVPQVAYQILKPIHDILNQ